MPPSEEDLRQEYESRQRILQRLRRRKNALEEQRATFGFQTTPEITIEIEDLEKQIDETERAIALLAGQLTGNPAAPSLTSGSGIDIPEELRLPFGQRRALLTESQGAILTFIEHHSRGDVYISQDTLEQRFRSFSKPELFYRIEHLRLLGLVERISTGQDATGRGRFMYRLSRSYRMYIGQGPQPA